MTRYSLRARMMVMILAPTLLIGLILSTFFVIHRYKELEQQLIDTGASIIEPLAIATQYKVSFHNRVTIRQLVSLLHRRHSDIVREIAVFDNTNTILGTSNYNRNPGLLRLHDGLPIPDALTVEQHGDSIILRTPITSKGAFPDEFPVKNASPTQPLGYVAIELNMQTLRLQQYKEIFFSALFMLACLLVAVLFAYRLMRHIIGPIGNMVSTVDRIRQGQLNSRVEGTMLGELNMLKNGINAMAMSIAAYHEEMQQHIDQATSDLRETLEQMEIQNVELQLAKKRAQEAARIKAEFLANMSHELRTPLNGVIGFTRQTLKTPLNATQRDYLLTIERSANNLLSLINDVLDFSKLEAGKLIFESIPFPLRATLDKSLILLAPSAHEKGIELTINIHSDVPDNVIGDPLRLQQVITNLVGNAIKFTRQGNIDIRIEKQACVNNKLRLEIQVKDTGIGIDDKQQTQLFQAFRQADASVSRRHGGTGLGLVITQKLVKEMGGKIAFQSRLHQGTTFWFVITLERDPHQADDTLSASLLSHRTLGVVEANPAAAQATLEMLRTLPLTVSYHSSIEGLTEPHYDVLLLGAPVTQQHNPQKIRSLIHALRHRADRLILALPAHLQVHAEELKAWGVAACITKPLVSTRLLPVLHDLYSHHLFTPEERARRPLTVMAVDDNPANLKLIGALLEEQVEHIVLCSSGEKAVQQACQQKVDLILMDIQMPEMDGIRASELIHQTNLNQQTPIVAVSAHTPDDVQKKLSRVGIKDYLAKPINEAKLCQLLARYSPVIAISCATTHSAQPPSLDWALALQQAANKADLARDLLQMLMDFLPEAREKITQHRRNNDVSGLREIIHKLHGSASYSGVPRIKKLCHQIEHHLLQHGKIADIEPELFELLDEMENVSTLAKKQLSESSAAAT